MNRFENDASPMVRQAHHDKTLTVQEQICQLLGWTAEQYSWYLYENGIAYLKVYLRNLNELIREFESNRLFWTWFKKMYREMDAALVDGSYNWGELKCAHALYDAVHDPEEVARERRPPRAVWEDVGEGFKVGKLKG